MWVYRHANSDGAPYEVGYYVNEDWQDIKNFVTEIEAARFVHYLNGGRGKAKRLLARGMEISE